MDICVRADGIPDSLQLMRWNSFRCDLFANTCRHAEFGPVTRGRLNTGYCVGVYMTMDGTQYQQIWSVQMALGTNTNTLTQ